MNAESATLDGLAPDGDVVRLEMPVTRVVVSFAAASGGTTPTPTPTPTPVPTPTPTPVTPAPVASLVLAPATLALTVGQADGALTATPKDVAGNALAGRTTTYASSDRAVVTVNAAGVVHQVAPGTAVIAATCEGKSATCAVAVSAAAPAPAPTPNPTPVPSSGGAYALGLYAMPTNGTSVDLPVIRDSQTITLRMGFDPAVWRAKLALGVRGVGLLQVGDGGEKVGDSYWDGDPRAQTIKLSSFFVAALGLSGPVAALIAAADLPPDNAAVAITLRIDQPGTGVRLTARRGDTGALIAPAATATLSAPRNATSWAGRMFVSPRQARTPENLGLWWFEAIAGLVADADEHRPPVADTSATPTRFGYDVRTLPLGTAAGALAVPCLTAGAPSTAVAGGRIYDPAVLTDDIVSDVVGPSAVAGFAGTTTGYRLGALNPWGRALPDNVLTVVSLDSTIAPVL